MVTICFFFALQYRLAATVQKILGHICWKNMKRNAVRESMFVFFARLNQDDFPLEHHTQVICPHVIVIAAADSQKKELVMTINANNIYDK